MESNVELRLQAKKWLTAIASGSTEQPVVPIWNSVRRHILHPELISKEETHVGQQLSEPTAGTAETICQTE